jgi:hypothetical protein
MVDTDEKAAKLAALWVLASVDRQRNHALRLEPSLRPFWARFVAAHEAKESSVFVAGCGAISTIRTFAGTGYELANRLSRFSSRSTERTVHSVQETQVREAVLRAQRSSSAQSIEEVQLGHTD